MPRKTKTTAAANKAAQQQFSAELLEQLISGPAVFMLYIPAMPHRVIAANHKNVDAVWPQDAAVGLQSITGQGGTGWATVAEGA